MRRLRKGLFGALGAAVISLPAAAQEICAKLGPPAPMPVMQGISGMRVLHGSASALAGAVDDLDGQGGVARGWPTSGRETSGSYRRPDRRLCLSGTNAGEQCGLLISCASDEVRYVLIDTEGRQVGAVTGNEPGRERTEVNMAVVGGEDTGGTGAVSEGAGLGSDGAKVVELADLGPYEQLGLLLAYGGDPEYLIPTYSDLNQFEQRRKQREARQRVVEQAAEFRNSETVLKIKNMPFVPREYNFEREYFQSCIPRSIELHQTGIEQGSTPRIKPIYPEKYIEAKNSVCGLMGTITDDLSSSSISNGSYYWLHYLFIDPEYAEIVSLAGDRGEARITTWCRMFKPSEAGKAGVGYCVVEKLRIIAPRPNGDGAIYVDFGRDGQDWTKTGRGSL